MERLGIITRYRQHEVTHAAIMLADIARNSGMPASIYGLGNVLRNVAGDWDSKVITERQQILPYWAERHDRIIWTHVPPVADIRAANDMGIDTVLLLSWEELVAAHQQTVLSFNKVIIPYRCAFHVLQRRWSVSKTRPIIMPWDTYTPITRKPYGDSPHDKLCAYFPLYDSQPTRVDQAIFKVMEKVLTSIETTDVLIAVGKGWALSSRKILRALQRKYAGRVEIVHAPDAFQRMLLFARADLTVWAPKFESLGLIGLSSLCMGTPVISWDIRPQNEFLIGWKNSVLVPAVTKENWLGVPYVQGGYSEFAEILVSTLRDKGLIAKMKSNASTGLDNRRRQFEAGWAELHK